jgi:hypothetical protein
MPEPTLNMSKPQESSDNAALPSVSRRIEEPYLIARIAEFKTKTVIDDWPLCPVHGTRVSIHEEGVPAPWGPPGFVVKFTGCCDSALNGFFQFMDRKLQLVSS